MMSMFQILVSMCEHFFLSGQIFDGMNKVCDRSRCYPRVIWTCWDNPLVPEDIEEMINITRRSLKNFNFTYFFLNNRNLSLFLNTKTFPVEYAKLKSVASRFDYVRVSLLERFGGIWIDASVYVTSGVEFESKFLEAIKHGSLLFGFQHVKQLLISSFLFGAPEGSEIMVVFKKEYDFALEQDHIKYSKKVCGILYTPNERRKSPCRDIYYFFEHIFLWMILQKPQFAKDIFLFPMTTNYPTRLLMECRHEKKCFRHRLKYDLVARKYPIIKAASCVREGKKNYMGDPDYTPNPPYIHTFQTKLKKKKNRNRDKRKTNH